MKPRDTALLNRAFAEADKAEWLWTAPNPRVGALALHQGHVVGHGYHRRFAQAHAEEAALQDAGAIQDGVALAGHVDEIVVSLEPCSARDGAKKRRPCVQWLLEAEVKRVVVGALDPDPRHAGKGLEQLRSAGVEVICSEQQQRFECQNPAFLAALAQPKRPWILLKWAATFDGRSAAANGVSQWITGPRARQEVHGLRAVSHGVMAGKTTVILDNPQLTARSDEGNSNPQLSRVLVGAAASINADCALLQDDNPRIWIESDLQTLPSWATSADHLLLAPRNNQGQLQLADAMQSLLEDFRINRLLVEGGAQLHGSLLAAGLADAIVRYEAPILLGGGLGCVAGEGVDHPQNAWRLFEEERCQLDQDLRRAFLIETGQ